MHSPFTVFALIVACCAATAWVACRGHQPVLVAYFLCGAVIGPLGLGLVEDTGMVAGISRIGVSLLLFLAGLVLHPDRLATYMRTAAFVTLGGCLIAWATVTAVLRILGYSLSDSNLAGLALMFSSTILVVKLLPTTTLHQKRMGSICIAILIAQDLLAIVVLLFLGSGDASPLAAVILLPKVLLLIAAAVAAEQFVIRPMMRMSDRYPEVLTMLCLGWCLGTAALTELAGVPYEIGAFVAGVAMARGKIALVLSEELKPLRDFFLMFFFFVLGASFSPDRLHAAWLPALVLTGLIVVARPLSLRWLFTLAGEETGFAAETGARLGQASEFGLIIAASAVAARRLNADVAQLVQLTILLTMLASSYLVVFRYPTPIGVNPRLQRD